MEASGTRVFLNPKKKSAQHSEHTDTINFSKINSEIVPETIRTKSVRKRKGVTEAEDIYPDMLPRTRRKKLIRSARYIIRSHGNPLGVSPKQRRDEEILADLDNYDWNLINERLVKKEQDEEEVKGLKWFIKEMKSLKSYTDPSPGFRLTRPMAKSFFNNFRHWKTRAGQGLPLRNNVSRAHSELILRTANDVFGVPQIRSLLRGMDDFLEDWTKQQVSGLGLLPGNKPTEYFMKALEVRKAIIKQTSMMVPIYLHHVFALLEEHRPEVHFTEKMGEILDFVTRMWKAIKTPDHAFYEEFKLDPKDDTRIKNMFDLAWVPNVAFDELRRPQQQIQLAETIAKGWLKKEIPNIEETVDLNPSCRLFQLIHRILIHSNYQTIQQVARELEDRKTRRLQVERVP